jgi:acyl carrier protein
MYMQMQIEIEEAVLRVLKSYNNQATLNETWEELRFDSLTTVEVVMDLEKEFSESFPDDVVEAWETGNDIVKFLKS